jgi:hypothetical protein
MWNAGSHKTSTTLAQEAGNSCSTSKCTQPVSHTSAPDEDGNWLYSPNYVSDPVPVSGGLRMCVDCKGSIDPRMRATFRQMLQEELATLGDDAAVVVAD